MTVHPSEFQSDRPVLVEKMKMDPELQLDMPTRARYLGLRFFAWAFGTILLIITTMFTTLRYLLPPSSSPPSSDLRVMTSGGFAAAYRRLLPQFESATGSQVESLWTPSMGATPEAIPNRFARGETADVLIMVGYALDEMIKNGIVRPDSRVELADSRIGVAVKEGEKIPDVSTVEKFKQVLLEAKSVAYSDSASGVYVKNHLFKKMGIEEEMVGKAVMIARTPVAEQIAAGKYEIGLQQVSELMPIEGISFAGKIPESLQSVTRFAGGIPITAPHPEEGMSLLRFMASPERADDVTKTGLDLVL